MDGEKEMNFENLIKQKGVTETSKGLINPEQHDNKIDYLKEFDKTHPEYKPNAEHLPIKAIGEMAWDYYLKQNEKSVYDKWKNPKLAAHYLNVARDCLSSKEIQERLGLMRKVEE